MNKSTLIFLILTLAILKSAAAQNVIFNTKEYAGIELHIEQEANENSNELLLSLTFTNLTDSARRILLKELMGFPMGVFAAIIDENEENIVKHGSKHIYSSQLYTSEQLESEKIELNSNETKQRTVKLLDIVELKDGLKELTKGNYKVQCSYFGISSNELSIRIY